jgi:hypothetical protein
MSPTNGKKTRAYAPTACRAASGIVDTFREGSSSGSSPQSRLIETEVDVAVFAVAFEGPDGLAP